MAILNLTQHQATKEQLDMGVVELPPELKEELVKLLTFETLDNTNHMLQRAQAIVTIAKVARATSVMIGGAPFFMPILQEALLGARIYPYYAFSERVVEEIHTSDGVVKKTIFKHQGFVPGFEI